MSKPRRSADAHWHSMMRCVARELLKHPTHRPHWYHFMRLGSAVTTDQAEKVGLADQLLLRLLHGSAMAGELQEIGGDHFQALICDLNVMLRRTGRKVLGERLDALSKLGLLIHTVRYTLIKRRV